ncbi:MAG: AAA family ATPase [Candidatus Omnitrophica bacterium]|nr:AAA family ATPase [Candidatus Omnitrophota bacterium]
MTESQKRSASASTKSPSLEGTRENNSALSELLPREQLDKLSALQLVDLIASKLPSRHTSILDLIYLRDRIGEMEEMQEQARQAVEKLSAAVEKLRAPALRIGTFLMPIDPDRALICISGTDYVCQVDPQVPLNSLQIGQRVQCNEAFAVVQGLGFDRTGPVLRIDELLSDGRLRIGQESGLMPLVLQRSALLAKEKLKPGMDVRVDHNQRIALEVLGMGKRTDRILETVTELPWSAIGGQAAAVQAIREAIEMPFLHRDLFRRFDYALPKGFLLHGPPGCGKTLLGKATAYNLRKQIKAQTRVDHPEFFLHVKGPEILNMWVGESERQVRDLFAQCRERAREGALAFLFIDEAESILGVRHGSHQHSMVNTLVPMFCSEMDGLEPLQNVVVILASNRADLIDPAILRPGRIDRKIKVNRPNEEGAQAIYEIYLTDSLPLAESKMQLAQAVTREHYARTPANAFLEIVYRSGRKEMLYRGDLASGAIIAAVVRRAKGLAIKRAIETSQETKLTREDLFNALQMEYAENDLFPSSDLTEDWLKLTDFDPDNVIRLGAVRPQKAEPTSMI